MIRIVISNTFEEWSDLNYRLSVEFNKSKGFCKSWSEPKTYSGDYATVVDTWAESKLTPSEISSIVEIEEISDLQ